MTDWLRTWILGLVGTAVICCAAEVLTPKGQAKSVVKLLCGIAMTAALLSPLLQIPLSDYGLNLAKYRAEADKLTDGAEAAARNLDRSYIEAGLTAYILDKAAETGTELDGAAVELRWSTEGVWVPMAAELEGTYDPALARLIEAELGIPQSAQKWRDDEDF